MADVWIKSALFQASGSTGNQDLTISGIGTPKAAIFIHGQATALDAVDASLVWSVGFTDGTNQFSAATIDVALQGTTDTKRRQATDEVIMRLGVAGAIDAEANFNSFITDGARITWGDATGGAEYFAVIFFGGADFQAAVGTATLGNSGVAVTATAGFPVEAGMVLGVGMATMDTAVVEAIFSLGLFQNSGSLTQKCLAFAAANGVTTTALSALAITNQVTAQVVAGSKTWGASVGNFTATQFDLTPDANTAGDIVGWLAMDFGGASLWCDIFDTPTATGVASHEGPAFEPEALILIGSGLTATGSVATDNTAGSVSVSAYDGTREWCIGGWNEDAVSTSNSATEVSANLVELKDDDGTALLDGTFDSFDSLGFNIDYSAVGASARKFIGFAMESQGGGVSISVPLAALSLTNNAPNIATGASVAVPLDQITITGQAPSLSAADGVTVSVPLSRMRMTEFTPVYSAGSLMTIRSNTAYDVYVKQGNGFWQPTRIVFTGTDHGSPQ